MSKRTWIIFGLVVTLMVVGIITGVTAANYNDGEASTANLIQSKWYDYSWLYRKEINISNGGGALTDYQMSITVDTATLIGAGKMLASGNDIRFTTDNGQTLIANYWIQGPMNSASTIIWVKTNVAAGSSYIYMYYGNSSATQASNGDNVFIYFNDFETDADVTEWTEVNPDGSAPYDRTRTRSTSQYTHGSSSMYVDDGATGSTYGVYVGFPSRNGTFTADYDIYPVQNTMRIEMSLRLTANIGTRLRLGNNTDGNDVDYSIGTTYYTLPTATPYSANTWYNFTLNEINPTGSPNDLYDVWVNGSQKADNIRWSSNRASLDRFYFVSLTSSETPKFYVDVVKVRQYAATVPTVTGFGSEE